MIRSTLCDKLLILRRRTHKVLVLLCLYSIMYLGLVYELFIFCYVTAVKCFVFNIISVTNYGCMMDDVAKKILRLFANKFI